MKDKMKSKELRGQVAVNLKGLRVFTFYLSQSLYCIVDICETYHAVAQYYSLLDFLIFLSSWWTVFFSQSVINANEKQGSANMR